MSVGLSMSDGRFSLIFMSIYVSIFFLHNSLLIVTGSDYNFSKLGNESFVELEHSTVVHKDHAQYYFSYKSRISYLDL